MTEKFTIGKRKLYISALLINIGFAIFFTLNSKPGCACISGEVEPYEITMKVLTTEMINPGMSKSDFINGWGKNEEYTIVSSTRYNKEIWRYNSLVDTNNGYTYIEKTDKPDLEGIRDGKVRVQWFIRWDDDDTLDSYSMFYKRPSDNKLVEYVVTDDKKTEKEIMLD